MHEQASFRPTVPIHIQAHNKKALTEFSVRAFCFFLELVKGLEPITCRLQISCSTD